MDLVREISSNHQNFRDIEVPFPELEEHQELHHQEAVCQPTDSEGTAYHSSSCSTTTANMESSVSTYKKSLTEEQPHRPSTSSADDDKCPLDVKLPPLTSSLPTSTSPPSSPPKRRMSYQDEMHSIDLCSVSNPASEIKRILDGLVIELKAEADKKSEGQVIEETSLDSGPCSPKRARTSLASEEGAEEAEIEVDAAQDHQEETDQENETSEIPTEEADQLPSQDSSKQEHLIQTIMTWMDAFQDSESIQLTILQSLPSLLEYSTLRFHAQSDGLASIVLYDMAAFTDNFLLQLTAFHTLVVLLRPLGAMEGTLVRKGGIDGGTVKGMETSKGGKGMKSITKEQASNPTNRNPQPDSIKSQPPTINTPSLPLWDENGVRVMLDSLRLYSHDRYLQAMGCWAMVNAALYPTLKKSLLKLGGVYVVTNAMMLHPSAEAVQFRGLFALINLVIPDGDADATSIQSHVYQIARLTILAMKNFQSNKSVLNRGCLVLRNLSLTPSHVAILARTPGCVDILLHCRQVCPRDALVQRSARTIMILIQRVTDRQTVWSGATASAATNRTGGAGFGAATLAAAASVGSDASVPAPRKEECGKRDRSSCSW